MPTNNELITAISKCKNTEMNTLDADSEQLDAVTTGNGPGSTILPIIDLARHVDSLGTDDAKIVETAVNNEGTHNIILSQGGGEDPDE